MKTDGGKGMIAESTKMETHWSAIFSNLPFGGDRCLYASVATRGI